MSDDEIDNASIRSSTANHDIRKWKKTHIFDQTMASATIETTLRSSHPDLYNTSAIDIFHKFLPVEYFEKVTEFSKMYAVQKDISIKLTTNDIMQFVGCLLLS